MYVKICKVSLKDTTSPPPPRIFEEVFEFDLNDARLEPLVGEQLAKSMLKVPQTPRMGVMDQQRELAVFQVLYMVGPNDGAGDCPIRNRRCHTPFLSETQLCPNAVWNR